MTENNSTPNIQELPSKASPSIPWVSKEVVTNIGIPNFKQPRRQNKRATVRQITGKNRVGRDFNVKWPGGRWYRVVLTSMSNTECVVEAEVFVASLRGLMLNVVEQMGRLNLKMSDRHFSVTMVRIEPKGETKTESIPILEGRAIAQHETPITNLKPIDEGLTL